jgi:hypothetical protein
MDEPQRQFLRNLLHQVLNSAIHSAVWRLPTIGLLVVIAAVGAAIWYYRLW